MTVDHDSGNGHETVDVIGCSVRGQKNEAKDVPCQDHNERRRLPGQRYVIVAADGLGSAGLSHVGSRVATQAVADYVEEAVTGTESLDEGTLRLELREAFVHAREQLHEVANSRGVAVGKLNTTLLVAVGGPAGVGGAAVGDGGIVWHRGGRTSLLVPREDTEYGNRTTPVQSDSWEESYRFGWASDADAAAVFSDGIDTVAWDGPASVSDDLFDQVFDNVREFSDTDRLERFLEDFLDGEALRQSSSDDKTLAVGALPTSEWSDPAETEPHESPVKDRHDEGAAAAGPTPGTGTGDTFGENTTRETREDRLGTADIDEQLGDNGTPRIVVTVGIVAVLVLSVLLVAALSTGSLLGSDGGGPGQFEMTMQSTNDTVEGENLAVTVEIENTGNTNQTQTVELNASGLGQNETNVTLGGRNATNTTVTLPTEAGDAGNYTATVSTLNETASANVTVLAPANFTVEILETNISAVESENLTVTAQIANEGDVGANQTVELNVSGLGGNETGVTLGGGNATNTTVTLPTEAGDAGSYNATVSSDDDTDNVSVIVRKDHTQPQNVPPDSTESSVRTVRSVESFGTAIPLTVTREQPPVQGDRVPGAVTAGRSDRVSGFEEPTGEASVRGIDESHFGERRSEQRVAGGRTKPRPYRTTTNLTDRLSGRE